MTSQMKLDNSNLGLKPSSHQKIVLSSNDSIIHICIIFAPIIYSYLFISIHIHSGPRHLSRHVI